MEIQLSNWILQLLLVFLVVDLFHLGEAIQSEEVGRKTADKNGRFCKLSFALEHFYVLGWDMCIKN